MWILRACIAHFPPKPSLTILSPRRGNREWFSAPLERQVYPIVVLFRAEYRANTIRLVSLLPCDCLICKSEQIFEKWSSALKFQNGFSKWCL